MADPFASAATRLLARLGREAVLRGTVQTRVDIARGVVQIGEMGQLMEPRDTAVLFSSVAPRVNDTLEVGGSVWILDGRITDDGYTTTHYIRPG